MFLPFRLFLPAALLLAGYRTAAQQLYGSVRDRSSMPFNTLLPYQRMPYAMLHDSNGPEGLNLAVPEIDSVLHAVTIVARQPVMVRRPDRSIFHVAGSAAANGSDALELLRKVPGVQTTNDNIRVAGKGAVMVMLDNKLLQLSGEDLAQTLRSIPSENILRIEVITTPPAAYDAAGNAGIIQIITRRSGIKGFTGNLSAAFFQRVRGSGMLSGSVQYRNHKLLLYASGMARKNTFSSDIVTNVYFPEQVQSQRLSQLNHAGYYSLELGMEYQLTNQMLLAVSGALRQNNKAISQAYNTTMAPPAAPVPDSFIRSLAQQQVCNSSPSLSADYSWRLDSMGSKCSLQGTYFATGNSNSRFLNSSNYLPAGQATGITADRSTYGAQQIRIQTFKADLQKLSSLGQLSLGAKSSFSGNNSSNGQRYSTMVPADTFRYREYVQAFYGSVQRSWRQWQLQSGLRVEYTYSKGFSTSMQTSNTHTYWQFFPVASLQFRASQALSFYMSYNRRIERPEYYALNPFRQYSTATMYTTGNPMLQPCIVNKLELGLIHQRGYSAVAYYTRSTGFFSGVSILDTASGTYAGSTANAGNNETAGLTLQARGKLLPHWEFYGQLDGFYSRQTDRYYGTGKAKGLPGGQVSVNSSLALGPARRFTVELGYQYQTSQMSDVYLEYHYGTLWGGAKVLCCQQQLTLALHIGDPFHSAYERTQNRYNKTYNSYYYDRRYLQLSAGWKWGNKQVKQKMQQEIPEELKRAG